MVVEDPVMVMFVAAGHLDSCCGCSTFCWKFFVGFPPTGVRLGKNEASSF